MSDSGFLFSAIFWIGVNAIIGYSIGKPKNAIADCVALSVILGPIGWLVSLAVKGQIRQCPFCAEQIKPEAKVCRFCGRDLPRPPIDPKTLLPRGKLPETKIPPPSGGWKKLPRDFK